MPKGVYERKERSRYSVRGWLAQARIGESLWTEQPQTSVQTTAARLGVNIRQDGFLAIHATTHEVVAINRVTVIVPKEGNHA